MFNEYLYVQVRHSSPECSVRVQSQLIQIILFLQQQQQLVLLWQEITIALQMQGGGPCFSEEFADEMIVRHAEESSVPVFASTVLANFTISVKMPVQGKHPARAERTRKAVNPKPLALCGIRATQLVAYYLTTRTPKHMCNLYVRKDSRQGHPNISERGFRNQPTTMRFTLATAARRENECSYMYVYSVFYNI